MSVLRRTNNGTFYAEGQGNEWYDEGTCPVGIHLGINDKGRLASLLCDRHSNKTTLYLNKSLLVKLGIELVEE